MAKKIKGKGVISGIAIGNILLAGQNLDSYLVAYKPASKAKEKKKAAEALIAVAENLKKSIDEFLSKDLKEQAGILDAHRMMVEDPAMSGAI
ncbi:MAG: phosphoenolpyruvate--protein phosphotransferase, partial [Selenomonadaceae bacterium]|nr:phosphoenolpyruvate--protein phosphotransferase [Selenomonadaceae bacterium]